MATPITFNAQEWQDEHPLKYTFLLSDILAVSTWHWLKYSCKSFLFLDVHMARAVTLYSCIKKNPMGVICEVTQRESACLL